MKLAPPAFHCLGDDAVRSRLQAEQCRFIEARAEREACYQRQETARAARQKALERNRPRSQSRMSRWRRKTPSSQNAMRGICRGC